MIKKKILISLTPFLLTSLYSNDIQEYKNPTKEINQNNENKNKDLEQRIQDMQKKEQIKELYSNVKDPELKKEEMERMKDPEFKKQEMEKMKNPEFRKQELEKMKDPEFRKQEMERMKDPEFRKQEMERMKDPEFRKQEMERMKDPEFRKQEMEKMNSPEFKKKELTQEDLEKKIENLTKTINELQKNNNSYENLEKLLTGENVSNQALEVNGLVKEEEKAETMLPEPIRIAKIGDKISLFVKYKILVDKESKTYEEKTIKINKGFEIEDWKLTKIERDSIEYTNQKENKKIIKYFNKATN
jgi:hypothetical protein